VKRAKGRVWDAKLKLKRLSLPSSGLLLCKEAYLLLMLKLGTA